MIAIGRMQVAEREALYPSRTFNDNDDDNNEDCEERYEQSLLPVCSGPEHCELADEDRDHVTDPVCYWQGEYGGVTSTRILFTPQTLESHAYLFDCEGVSSPEECCYRQNDGNDVM